MRLTMQKIVSVLYVVGHLRNPKREGFHKKVKVLKHTNILYWFLTFLTKQKTVAIGIRTLYSTFINCKVRCRTQYSNIPRSRQGYCVRMRKVKNTS